MIWDQYNIIIMEDKKITNLLDNTPNQRSKFKIKNLVKKKLWMTWSAQNRLPN